MANVIFSNLEDTAANIAASKRALLIAFDSTNKKLKYFDASTTEYEALTLDATGTPTRTIGDITTQALTATSAAIDGAVTINDSGADVDFRVKGNGDANLLFVDGGNDMVGIGTNAPQRKLSVSGAIGVNPNLSSALPAFGEGTLNGICIQSDIDNATTAGIREEAFLTLGRYATKRVWRLAAMGNSSYGRQPDLIFGCEEDDAGIIEMLRFKYDGKVGIGTTTPAEKLEVNGNAKASALQINADSGTADTDDALYFGGRTTEGSGRLRYDAATQTFYFESRGASTWSV